MVRRRPQASRTVCAGRGPVSPAVGPVPLSSTFVPKPRDCGGPRVSAPQGAYGPQPEIIQPPVLYGTGPSGRMM